MPLTLAEIQRIEALENEVAKLDRRVRIVFTCVWEDEDNPMQNGDAHRHFVKLPGGTGSVVSVTAMPVYEDGTDRALRIEDVVARARTDEHGDPSHEVHCRVVNVGHDAIDRYRISWAEVLPDVGFEPPICDGFELEG